MPPAAPLATTETFTISEDSASNFIELAYEDDNRDLALSARFTRRLIISMVMVFTR